MRVSTRVSTSKKAGTDSRINASVLALEWGIFSTPAGEMVIDGHRPNHSTFIHSRRPLFVVIDIAPCLVRTVLAPEEGEDWLLSSAIPLELLTESQWAELCLIDQDTYRKLRSYFDAGWWEL